MLPASHRLTDGSAFRETTRRGRRAPGRRVVLHLWLPGELPDRPGASAAPARVGFVVSRAVGGSVVRNRVQRRLRHLLATYVDALPAGSQLVVRALPASAGASSAELGSDVLAGLTRLDVVGALR